MTVFWKSITFTLHLCKSYVDVLPVNDLSTSNVPNDITVNSPADMVMWYFNTARWVNEKQMPQQVPVIDDYMSYKWTDLFSCHVNRNPA